MSKSGEEAIFGWLENLGYDQQLYSVRSRLFNLTVHSKAIKGSEKIEVKIREAIGTDIDDATTRLILKENGEDWEKGDGYRIVRHRSDNASYSIGFVNETNNVMMVDFDMTESQNVKFSNSGVVQKRTVEPQSTEILMNCSCGLGSSELK